MDVAKARRDPVTTEIDCGGDEPAKVTFNQAAITATFSREIRQIPDALEQNARFLAGTVLKWNLTDGEDPLPVSLETMMDLPVMVAASLVEGIMGAVSPNGKTPPGS